LADKNEHINLWILDRDRKENKAKLEKEMARQRQSERHHCPKCKNGFQEPKLIQYYVCPNCESRFEHELEQNKDGCQHWLGYLTQKDRSQSIPLECVESN
jgi:protein-arginine kinase activator protein McsA